MVAKNKTQFREWDESRYRNKDKQGFNSYWFTEKEKKEVMRIRADRKKELRDRKKYPPPKGVLDLMDDRIKELLAKVNPDDLDDRTVKLIESLDINLTVNSTV